MKNKPVQASIFNEWPYCFDHCRNFHAGPPFPVSREKRCDYGILKDGTSGESMELYEFDKSVRMRCKYFEEITKRSKR